VKDDRERLLDILEAVERIEKYTRRGRRAFESNELIQNWIIHHLQIIGEAARALSHSFKTKPSKIRWSEIIGMRNILVHDYFGIDVEVVWSTVKDDLPTLKRQIESILKEIRK